MKHPRQYLCAAALASLLLSACASADGRYPSLAVRDAERVQGNFNPASQGTAQDLAVSASGAQIADAILEASATANNLSILFDQEVDDVRALVAASQGLGGESDVRARALVGLAELTSLRGQTAIALADLDAVEAQQATGLGSVDDIRTAQSRIVSLIERQDAVLDSLSEALNR